MKRALVAGSLFLGVGCAGARVAKRVPPPTPARPAAELISQLSATDTTIRTAAAWGLVGADAADQTVVGALRAAFEDPSPSVREAATWAWSHLRGRKVEVGTPSDSPPRILRQTKPMYPQAAFDHKVEGTVKVELLIGEEGTVAHAEVVESLPGLDAAAVLCVRQWVFEPAQRGGKPVASVAIAPVSFRID